MMKYACHLMNDVLGQGPLHRIHQVACIIYNYISQSLSVSTMV